MPNGGGGPIPTLTDEVWDEIKDEKLDAYGGWNGDLLHLVQDGEGLGGVRWALGGDLSPKPVARMSAADWALIAGGTASGSEISSGGKTYVIAIEQGSGSGENSAAVHEVD
ncbi:MAG: hypothetical protein ACYS76_16410 [Planctomycetota bacterium]|jgi:hypothetical protein